MRSTPWIARSNLLQRSIQGVNHTFKYRITSGIVVDAHFLSMSNRPAKHCTALQSNFKALSFTTYCGGLDRMIVSFFTNSITPIGLNRWAGTAHGRSHFDICSTAIIKYWFPAFVRGKGPAMSMLHAWNSPLIEIFTYQPFRRRWFHLFTEIKRYFLPHIEQPKSVLYKRNSALKSYCPNSSCGPLKTLSPIFMWSTNRIPCSVRQNFFYDTIEFISSSSTFLDFSKRSRPSPADYTSNMLYLQALLRKLDYRQWPTVRLFDIDRRCMRYRALHYYKSHSHILRVDWTNVLLFHAGLSVVRLKFEPIRCWIVTKFFLCERNAECFSFQRIIIRFHPR